MKHNMITEPIDIGQSVKELCGNDRKTVNEINIRKDEVKSVRRTTVYKYTQTAKRLIFKTIFV